MSPRRAAFEIGGASVSAGKRGEVELPIARLATGTQVSLPIQVLHGRHTGPTVWINAAIHGDEISGVEVVRQVLKALDPKALHGTLLAVPIVNVHGFIAGDRYLPDRRDLNRSFPGSAKGSLARRIAHLMMTEVVSRSAFGIDLHTGSDGRSNLPQIRADLDDPETDRLAQVFAAPIRIHSRPRDGTLRGAATRAGARVLLFEGGEAFRFDAGAIRAAVEGSLRVFGALRLIDDPPPATGHTERVGKTRWVRARRSGLVELTCGLGERVEKGQTLGRIHDAFGRRLSRLTSPTDGVVIGLKLEALVHRGDALAHIATPFQGPS